MDNPGFSRQHQGDKMGQLAAATSSRNSSILGQLAPFEDQVISQAKWSCERGRLLKLGCSFSQLIVFTIDQIWQCAWNLWDGTQNPMVNHHPKFNIAILSKSFIFFQNCGYVKLPEGTILLVMTTNHPDAILPMIRWWNPSVLWLKYCIDGDSCPHDIIDGQICFWVCWTHWRYKLSTPLIHVKHNFELHEPTIWFKLKHN